MSLSLPVPVDDQELYKIEQEAMPNVEIPDADLPVSDTDPNKPILFNGHFLGFKGLEYDLSLYDAQQHREVNGTLVYELIQADSKVYLPVDNIEQAHAVEAVCNLYFRGW